MAASIFFIIQTRDKMDMLDINEITTSRNYISQIVSNVLPTENS